ncbi:uncharacterized protein LOC107492041 [Arachis duranensis]|uniref:Uncharacterized protein LOC107492041 n=1 Tax=Arachis duranensis TaxID=130453 RepID=A0A6P4DRK7_ARADU|nr:uncharacterized protein LOC107492041 [Arachis duranensis]
MSDGALQVLDGTHLRDVDLTLPPPPELHSALSGAYILDIAHSRVSASLFGLSLPQRLTATALTRLPAASDHHAFRSAEFDLEKASQILRDYVTAIADELKDNPLVVSVLDGSTLNLLLEDEDDFAMLAENLFTDLDVEDKGKISKSQIQNALSQMGVDMGVPPFSEFPQLNDLLRKHGADGEEELGQAQFAQLLQSVLQDLEEELSKKNVVYIHNIQIINGSKLRQVLGNEEELNSIVEKVLKEKAEAKDGLGNIEIIRSFLEKNAKELGLPRSEANEAVVLLYDDVFTNVAKAKGSAELEKEELVKLVKDILERLAEQLQSNPIFEEA